MEHRVPHDVGRELARKATALAFDTYAQKYATYQPKAHWTGDYQASVTFTVKGMSLAGKVEVREREIAMDLDVPFLLRPFRSVALEIIEREINVWCQKAKSGELK